MLSPKVSIATAVIALSGASVAYTARQSGPPPTPEMAQVLRQLADYKTPPIPSLTPLQARQLPDASDAVQELLTRQGKPAVDTSVDVDHTTIPANGTKLVARVYRPQGTAGQRLPVAVFLRGGGWVIANLDTYDASCRALSKLANCMVVSVSYRTAPEFKFPTAHEDSYAALQYVMRAAGQMGGDPSRVAIVGESAGGNMATAACIMAKERGGKMPKAQVLVYPVTQIGQVTPSYRQNRMAKPLDVPTLMWMGKQYMRTPADGKSKYLSPLRAPDSALRGLPPATIILAEIDPLRSEGEQYAAKLTRLGVRTNMKLYRGVTHEFFGMGAAVPEAMDAEQLAADALKTAFR